jgi:hypothetical protein
LAADVLAGGGGGACANTTEVRHTMTAMTPAATLRVAGLDLLIRTCLPEVR